MKLKWRHRKSPISKKSNRQIRSRLGAQRRLQSNSSTNGTSRDTQLLSLLAARRRQILTDRLNAHIATIASLAQKPYRGNGTHAHLEILDKNNTVISKITIPENNSNVKFQWDTRNANIKSVPRSEESKSSDNKTSTLIKALQDAKTSRAGYLNNRRKLPPDGFRFGAGPRKSVIDLQISSEENSNFKKADLSFPYDKKQDYENSEVLLEPEEEFQVDESNHGFYLLNYTAENMTRAVYNETPNDVELIELKLPLFGNENISRIIDDTENLINRSAKDEYHNLSQPHLRASEIAPPAIKIQDSRTNKEMKVDSVAKDNDNNTLFISDELYNHFRPLESELPVEDMQPFLFFGQKLNINNLQKDNLSLFANVSLSTKTGQYLTTPEKKRNLFRIPVTEKTKYFINDDEDEVNEDMDVSVVKNIIEKNKVRNTNKQSTTVRDSSLVSAYRKSTVTTALPPITTSLSVENQTSAIVNQTEMVDIDETVASESKVRIKENAYNRSALIIAPRVNRTYTFRRKPAKIISLNSTHSPDLTLVVSTTPPPQSTTLVYTAVVTSVSITSSIKGQNHTDPKNDTQISYKQIAEEISNDKLLNNTTKNLSQIESTKSNDSVFNSTQYPSLNISDPSEMRIRKRPEFRHRPHRIRRISTTEKSITLNLTDTPSTPFVLYPSNIEHNSSAKFDLDMTTEVISQHNSTNLGYKNETVENNSEPLSIGTRIFLQDDSIGQGENNIGVNVFPEQSTSVKPAISSQQTQYYNNTLRGKTPLENIPKIEDFGGNILNTSGENSSYYYTDGGTTESALTTELKDNLTSFNTTANQNNTTSNGTVDNGKELLSGKTGEVIIEAGNTNVATYILAALGFVPIIAIVFVVMRNIILKKAKDMDTEYEGYFQDLDLKKDAQVTPVARPPTQPSKKPDEKWEFPRSKLRLQTLLGQGNFGQVWKAEADDLKGHDGLTRLVAVKTIKEAASQKEKQELLHEICIMQKIGTHPNVVTLLACCTEQEPYLLIMEYVMCGKLLTYLRERRSRPDRFGGASGTLTSRDLTVFAYCVARGMEYLASKGVVHRDLAARNILVDHNKLCKIADFGMSREVVISESDGGSGGECGRSQRHALPVRWMAPEALLYNIYNHETDVWAYGVLLWEIVTLGSTPYASMTGRQVLHMVTEGYRLERPAHCKPHLYRTMHACWHADPSHRPPFSDIKKQLAELLDNEPTEGHYVDLESFYQDSSVYSDPSAIIQNDGGISIEYSRELKPQAMTEEPKRRSFNQIAAAGNLQRNHSSSFGSRNGFNDDFITLRSNSHGSKIGATRMGGFGISNIAFNARESDFSERKDKLSGLSFQNRDRENNLIVRDNAGVASRNSFSTSYQNRHGGREGGRGFFVNSGSNRSKRMTEFECNI